MDGWLLDPEFDPDFSTSNLFIDLDYLTYEDMSGEWENVRSRFDPDFATSNPFPVLN